MCNNLLQQNLKIELCETFHAKHTEIPESSLSNKCFLFELIVWLQVGHSTTQLRIHDSYCSQFNNSQTTIIAYQHEEEEISIVEWFFKLFFISEANVRTFKPSAMFKEKVWTTGDFATEKNLEEKHMFQWEISPWVQKERGKQHVSSTVTVPESCILWIAFWDIQGFFFYICWCSREHRGQSKQPNYLMLYVHFKVTQGFICWWLNQLSDHSDTFWKNLPWKLTWQNKIWLSAHTNPKPNISLCYFYYFLVHPHLRNIQSEGLYKAQGIRRGHRVFFKADRIFFLPHLELTHSEALKYHIGNCDSLPWQHLSCNYFPSSPMLRTEKTDHFTWACAEACLFTGHMKKKTEKESPSWLKNYLRDMSMTLAMLISWGQRTRAFWELHIALSNLWL